MADRQKDYLWGEAVNIRMQCRILFLLAMLVVSFGCRQEEQAPAVKETAAGSPAALTIVAIGDSLTAGMGVEEGEAYPALLEAALRSAGHDVRVINAGISGETTSGTLARLDWVMTLEPDIAILETGANDGLRGLDTAMVRDNLRRIIQTLQGKGVVVVLAGMQMVWNLGPAYTSEFNRIYPELAKEEGVILMPFFLEGVAMRPEFNQDDGLHPNPAGYRIIAQRVRPYVEEAIAALKNVAGSPGSEEGAQ